MADWDAPSPPPGDSSGGLRADAAVFQPLRADAPVFQPGGFAPPQQPAANVAADAAVAAEEEPAATVEAPPQEEPSAVAATESVAAAVEPPAKEVASLPSPVAETESKKGKEKVEEKFHDDREHVNIVFIGHVDAGKSTLSGQILVLTNQVDERDMQKFKALAKEKNRDSWWVAYIMDTNEDERNKGKTVEVGRAQFSTVKKRYTILDAPGHKNYVPAMINGAAQADVGVLVISARKGEFEAGFDRGGQTREHAMLAKTLGIQKLVVGINKMDNKTVQWRKERYDDIIAKLAKFLKGCGYSKKDIVYLPFSGLTGINVKEPLTKDVCDWYDGKSLLDTLDGLKTIKRDANAALRVPILDKYKDQGSIVAIGKVESGILRNDSFVKIMPSGVKAKVVHIGVDDADKEGVTMVKGGENVNVSLKGIDEDKLHGGDVMCPIDNVCPRVKSFDGEMYISDLLDHKPILTAGYLCVLHIHTASVEVEIAKLLYERDRKTGQKKKRPPPFVRSQVNVGVKIDLSDICAIERYKDFPQLGRFTLRDEGKTIAIGKVVAVHEE